ncbi:hypothetical protein GCM10018965_058310 [Nonomuraea roseola]
MPDTCPWTSPLTTPRSGGVAVRRAGPRALRRLHQTAAPLATERRAVQVGGGSAVNGEVRQWQSGMGLDPSEVLGSR